MRSIDAHLCQVEHQPSRAARDRWLVAPLLSDLSVGVVTVLTAVLLIAASVLPANASPAWVPTELLSPANNETDTAASLSCPTAGNCTSVGYYVDSFAYRHALGFDESSGSWATGLVAMLPANAFSGDANSQLDSVSCASAGNCAAVGYYTDSSGNQQGLLLKETAGLWGTGVEATLPGNAANNPRAYLASVSCPLAGECAAVGYYYDAAGNEQALIVKETATGWLTLSAVGLPANAGANRAAELDSVSCPSAGNCEAVGYYLLNVGNSEALIVRQTVGTWSRGGEPALPANAGHVNGSPVSGLASVSCPPVGNCDAVGFYLDGSGASQGLMVDEYRGVEAVLPSNAAPVNQASELGSVSCRLAGYCSAVGFYRVVATGQQAVLLRETAAHWHAGVQAALPANASALQHQTFYSGAISCYSPGNCAVAGSYTDTSAYDQGFVLRQTSGAWGVGVEARLPGNARGNPQGPGVGLDSVSCTTTGRCAAAGWYQTKSGFGGGLFLQG